MNRFTTRLLYLVILIGIMLSAEGSAYALTQVSRRLVVYVSDVNTHVAIGGASVFLDGSFVGVTDSSGRLLIGRANNQQRPSVQKDGYRFLGMTTDTTNGDLVAYMALNSRLHIDGRWIKDAAGTIVRLKGAAIFWKFTYSSGYSDYNPLSYNDEINEASLDTFKKTGANFIRLTVNGWIWYVKKAPSYVAAVDTVISWSKARGIMVVLDNHAPWYDTDNSVVYKDQFALATALTEWRNFMVQLAERYKDEPAVIGFDMLNEPSKNIGWATWRANVLNVVQAIHAVDSSYLCFVEPLGSSAETDDMDNFKTNPLPEQNIVYSAHNYYSWDYPWFDYAKSYGDGNFDLAKQQMEALYYQRFLDMLDAGLPVVNMESGIYRDVSAGNPNWEKYMDDALSLYEKYGAGVCWYPFDPDRQDSSLISLLSADRISLTAVGSLWAVHMTSST